MILTNEEKVVLEKWRDNACRQHEMPVLADAMLRLFPPGYLDEITPERLVEAGFRVASVAGGVRVYECVTGPVRVSMRLDNYETTWWLEAPEWMDYITDIIKPRNMGEVLELVQRCKEGT